MSIGGKGTVLIFAYECYPYNRSGSTIGAQRPYHFAQHLSKLGWKVLVLCCDKDRRRTITKKECSSIVDREYQLHAEALKTEACVIVPLPSLNYYGWSDWLWDKTVLVNKGGHFVAKGFPFSLIRKAATFYNQLVHGDYSSSWIPVAEKFTARLLTTHKIDIIIGEHSPDAGILLANKISKLYNIPWVADFRDPVLWPFKGLLKYLYTPLIKRKLNSVSATINVNPYWTSLDEKLFLKPAYSIINGYDHELLEKVEAYNFKKFVVSYFGSFNHRFQDINPSLKAYAEFLKKHDCPEDVLLFYRGLQWQEFLTSCEDSGVPLTNVDVDTFVQREEGISYMKGSAVLLIYSIPPYKSTSVYETQGFYPGKAFEYIGAEVPMLLVPSDYGLLASLIKKLGKGEVADSVEQAIVSLDNYYKNWKTGESVITTNKNVLLYSRQAQAIQLDRILTLYKGG